MRALLPPSVVLLESPVGNHMDEIDLQEQALVSHAVRSRQNEFSTGRLLASQALRKLGALPMPVLCGPMNEPLWPPEVVGSITHTSDVCLVALANVASIRSIGIDIEADRAEFDNLAHLILRPEEVQATGKNTQSLTATTRLAFCAKESIYKAVSRRANRFIDFQEVLVNFEPDAGRFTATAPDDVELNALFDGGTGRYTLATNRLFAAWYEED
jgi:4'-phosphopantetheinyl transferase EntD